MLVLPVGLILSGIIVQVVGQVAKLDGTSTTQFSIRANGTTPTTMMAGDDGELVLPNGLTVSGGVISFYGAAVENLSAVTTCDINGGAIDGTPIGAASRSTGAFTSLAANNGLTISGGVISFYGAAVDNLSGVTTCDINGGTIDGVTINNSAIGGSTPAAGAFTTVSASGQITSTVTPSAPFVLSSNTKVSNLHADLWDSLSANTMTSGEYGGVLFYGSPFISYVSASASGTTGQFLASGGGVLASCTPTWKGLTNAHIFVGNSSNIPTDVAVSGDVTINNLGVTDIAANCISAAELASSLQAMMPQISSLSAGSEVADVKRVSFEVGMPSGATVDGYYLVAWCIADSANSTTVTVRSVTTAYVYGSDWDVVTANKKAWAYTDSLARLYVDVTLSGDYTVYFNVSLAGQTASVALDFN
jgi:hypothetical protein